MKRTIAIAISALCMCLFLSCANCFPCAQVVTYEVIGVTGSNVSVEFHNDYGDTELYSSVRMPWVKTFTVKYRTKEEHGGNHPGNVFPAYVSASMAGRFGTVTAIIYVNGVEKKRAVATPDHQIATARYSIRL